MGCTRACDAQHPKTDIIVASITLSRCSPRIRKGNARTRRLCSGAELALEFEVQQPKMGRKGDEGATASCSEAKKRSAG